MVAGSGAGIFQASIISDGGSGLTPDFAVKITPKPLLYSSLTFPKGTRDQGEMLSLEAEKGLPPAGNLLSSSPFPFSRCQSLVFKGKC